MDDFTYDVVCKKRIARGSAHMKRGSKSKKCSLPSDGMTQAEWKRRNGTVMTYNLNAPMDWRSFKAMPYDLQQQYVDNLQSRFSVGVVTISRELFDLSDAALTVHLKRHGMRFETFKGKGADIHWTRWLDGSLPSQNEPEKCDKSTENSPEKCDNALLSISEKNAEMESEEQPSTSVFDLTELSATFSGEFNPSEFFLWLTKLPIPQAEVQIKVEVKKL